MTWPELHGGHPHLVFQDDINHCPEQGGRVRCIADVTKPGLTRRILLHEQTQAPAAIGDHDDQTLECQAAREERFRALSCNRPCVENRAINLRTYTTARGTPRVA